MMKGEMPKGKQKGNDSYMSAGKDVYSMYMKGCDGELHKGQMSKGKHKGKDTYTSSSKDQYPIGGVETSRKVPPPMPDWVDRRLGAVPAPALRNRPASVLADPSELLNSPLVDTPPIRGDRMHEQMSWFFQVEQPQSLPDMRKMNDFSYSSHGTSNGKGGGKLRFDGFSTYDGHSQVSSASTAAIGPGSLRPGPGDTLSQLYSTMSSNTSGCTADSGPPLRNGVERSTVEATAEFVSNNSLIELRECTQEVGHDTVWLRVVHSGYGKDTWRSCLRSSKHKCYFAQSLGEGAYVQLLPGWKSDDLVAELTEINLDVRRRVRFNKMNRCNKSRLQFKQDLILVRYEDN
jgi:hypothetical protein